MNNFKTALTRKFGPLPAWAWALLGGLGIYLYRKARGDYAATSPSVTDSTGGFTPQDPVTLAPGESVYDPNTGQLTSTAPEQQTPPDIIPPEPGTPLEPVTVGPGESVYDPGTGDLLTPGGGKGKKKPPKHHPHKPRGKHPKPHHTGKGKNKKHPGHKESGHKSKPHGKATHKPPSSRTKHPTPGHRAPTPTHHPPGTVPHTHTHTHSSAPAHGAGGSAGHRVQHDPNQGRPGGAHNTARPRGTAPGPVRPAHPAGGRTPVTPSHTTRPPVVRQRPQASHPAASGPSQNHPRATPPRPAAPRPAPPRPGKKRR